MTTAALQRTNMVESQVRPSDITDRRIVRAMQAVPREDFAPADKAQVVYGDLDVPLTAPKPGQRGRELMSARIFAKLAQLCEIEATDTVLIVGAGMGYSAAVLSNIANVVVALESDTALSAHAREALAKHKIKNAHVVGGALAAGHADAASYNAILIEGAIATEPAALLTQLAPGGRLVAIVGTGASAKATLWRRHGSGTSAIEAFDASAGLLPGFEKAAAFTF